MKSKKSFVIITLLFTSTLTIFSSLFISNSVASNPLDWGFPPAPPNNESYWDFDNNTIITWHVDTNSSPSADYTYNISSMNYLVNGSGENINGYCVILNKMFFNTTTEQLQEYNDPEAHPVFNASCTNYTWSGVGIIRPHRFGIPGYGTLVNPFLTKNSTHDLDIYWSAKALTYAYAWFLNDTFTLPEYKVDLPTRSIDYWNATHGTYINSTYYDNGTLKEAKMKVTLDGGTSLIEINITHTNWVNPVDKVEWAVAPGETIDYIENGNPLKLKIINFTITLATSLKTMGSEYVQIVWANVSAWNGTH